VAAANLQASVAVQREHAGLVESLMHGQGALAVSLTDVADTPIWEPGLDETPLWAEVTVTGLFAAGTDTAVVSAALSLAPGIDGPAAVQWLELADRAWERAWLDRFAPMAFGARLWIVPTGMECPDPQAIQLHLDPGLAFGTGTHPTTRLCLEWIEGADLAGKTVLDFGCGSGVLGIAAALCGAAQVLCVDYDPQAIEATRDNAARNGVADRLDAVCADTPPAGTFDVVLSNILAGILVRLADPLQAAGGAGAAMALAGILDEQAGQVVAAFPRLHQSQRRSHEGWVLISGELDRS
jgi:ribosomal protein L11 methyltransferase